MDAPNGVMTLVAAVVKDLKDDEGLGRVRVEFPHLNNELSDLCRLVTPMAGPERGFFFKPQPGDEVLVGFELNDKRRGYILGGLWSTEDRPPPRATEEPEENNLRFIHTRSGHILRFDDTPNAEKIELIASGGNQRVVLDVATKKIEVVNTAGDIDVSATNGKVTITAVTVEVRATGKMDLTAGGALTIKGASVAINPPGP